MSLKWKKVGRDVWFGEEGSYRYTIGRGPFPLGGSRFYITRGGTATIGYFSSCATLQRAKQIAQEAATKQEDRIMALPNYDPKTFMKD